MASSSAAEILKEVGGSQNIVSLTHCATRLRFELVDASELDQKRIEAIPGVLGAVPQAGNRYQIVMGGAVQSTYSDIMALPEMSGGTGASGDDIAAVKAAARAKGPRGKIAWLDSLFEYLSDSFRPIIGALLGASLFITFMALMATLGVIPAWNDSRVTLDASWQFVNLTWKAVFVFLPLLVAYNASKKLGADPWVGFAIMGVTMLPGFTALGSADGAYTVTFPGLTSSVQVVDIFGIPLTVFDYSSQVFPPLLMAAILGPLYKGLKKLIPENVQLIFVPFLSMLIMIPLTAFIIGPIGVYVGAGLAAVLNAINSFSPFIFAIVIPLAYPFMVPLGLHWPINAIMLLNIQTLGYDFIQGPMGAWNFACFGATAGVLVLSIREKDLQMRQTATGALAAGLLGGISEPSLYGIHLRYKRIYPRMLVGCVAGGLVMGLFGGVKTSAFVFTSLLTIPAFDNVWVYALGVAVAFVLAMVLVIMSGYKDPEPKAAAAAATPAETSAATAGAAGAASVAAAAAPGATATATESKTVVATILAPVDGVIVPLEQVPDPVFSKGIVGPGVGIDPTSDVVVAPGDGKVVVAQPTGHAFGLLLDSGVEVLIHVGIDTVKLGGKGFSVKVSAGDRVTAGTPLVAFDRAVIEDAGYSLVTPVLVTNHAAFSSVDPVASGRVSVGDALLTVSK